ncbi:Nodulation protein Z NodZ [Nitzschia inconspicua]|uniref:Nodulation protein Z NodZ n=1 Tax=Nitzschia inconspicua TaxID=303405 RepID=A0A9K3LA91_9STRA|nr:Nodulation protein Z NodZ [Nitzschia inconspicua]
MAQRMSKQQQQQQQKSIRNHHTWMSTIITIIRCTRGIRRILCNNLQFIVLTACALWFCWVVWSHYRVLLVLGVQQDDKHFPRNSVQVASSNNNSNYTMSQQQRDSSVIAGVINNNEVIHRAFFGLGHRLHRSAAAWHLAHTLTNITHFRFHWESCYNSSQHHGNRNEEVENQKEREYNVFRYLFGNDIWELDPASTSPSILVSTPNTSNNTAAAAAEAASPVGPVSYHRKMIVIRNDVYGYIKGQLYKDLHLPIQQHSPTTKTTTTTASRRNNNSNSLSQQSSLSYFFDDKIQSDVGFYQRLTRQYRFQSQVNDFMDRYRFSKRLVVGVHLRAGNGEGLHFQQAGRGVQMNETVFVERMVQTMRNVISSQRSTHPQQDDTAVLLSPIIFLATDTAHLIPIFQQATKEYLNIETVVLEQLRLNINQGVTFEALAGTGDECLEGWKAMVNDMILLSHVNVLVAARYSTFTQSLPLSMIFHRQQTFCEVSEDGKSMTCVSGDIHAWLFRQMPSVQSQTFTMDTSSKTNTDDVIVIHPITLLLPDVEPPMEFAQAQRFLQTQSLELESVFPYGSTKLFKKYRNRKNDVVVATEPSQWNFVSSQFP